jgi:hypothetical protein
MTSERRRNSVAGGRSDSGHVILESRPRARLATTAVEKQDEQKSERDRSSDSNSRSYRRRVNRVFAAGGARDVAVGGRDDLRG